MGIEDLEREGELCPPGGSPYGYYVLCITWYRIGVRDSEGVVIAWISGVAERLMRQLAPETRRWTHRVRVRTEFVPTLSHLALRLSRVSLLVSWSRIFGTRERVE